MSLSLLGLNTRYVSADNSTSLHCFCNKATISVKAVGELIYHNYQLHRLANNHQPERHNRIMNKNKTKPVAHQLSRVRFCRSLSLADYGPRDVCLRRSDHHGSSIERASQSVHSGHGHSGQTDQRVFLCFASPHSVDQLDAMRKLVDMKSFFFSEIWDIQRFSMPEENNVIK